ncbi:hypothetical protein ACHAW6_010801 [Cyclotella cf. meneghiniana]
MSTAAASLSPLIHRLSGIYRDPQRVLRDAESLLASPLGNHLRPTTEPLLNNDGTSTPPVLVLSGTLPMTYRGVTYNLPIDVFLPPPYPLRPPTVFVRPVATMAIRENHRHVALDGQVYLPYLHEWRPNTHDLTELAVWMSSTFGSDPPCYSRPVAISRPATNPSPPSYPASVNSSYGSNASANSSIDEQRRIDIEREIAEANIAAEAARNAAIEEARIERQAQELQRQHDEQLSSLRVLATSKAQDRVRQVFDGMRDELRRELKDQKVLELGKEKIEQLLREGQKRKNLLLKENSSIDEAIHSLETWIEAVEQHKKKSEEENSSNEKDDQRKVDVLAIPVDTYSAQMLALSSETAAIDDCIYFLDRSLVKGNITLDVFLKEVRKLSKRQFMAKAHLMKIAQMKTLVR